eukprot:3940826-Rhodomonas_salina.4
MVGTDTRVLLPRDRRKPILLWLLLHANVYTLAHVLCDVRTETATLLCKYEVIYRDVLCDATVTCNAILRYFRTETARVTCTDMTLFTSIWIRKSEPPNGTLDPSHVPPFADDISQSQRDFVGGQFEKLVEDSESDECRGQVRQLVEAASSQHRKQTRVEIGLKITKVRRDDDDNESDDGGGGGGDDGSDDNGDAMIVMMVMMVMMMMMMMMVMIMLLMMMMMMQRRGKKMMTIDDDD